VNLGRCLGVSRRGGDGGIELMGCGAREVGGERAYVCLRNGRW
jgi:hypothetical protein